MRGEEEKGRECISCGDISLCNLEIIWLGKLWLIILGCKRECGKLNQLQGDVLQLANFFLLHKYMKKYDRVKAIGYQMGFIFFSFWALFLTVCFNSS